MGNNMKKTAAIYAVLALLSCNASALIDISLTPDTAWDVGTGGVVDEVNASPYTIQNNGDAVRINVKGTDTANWRLGVAPGLNAFAMKWNTVPGKEDTNWRSIYSADTNMFTSLGTNSSQAFYLRYLSPKYITEGNGAVQNTALKLTAVSPYIGNWVLRALTPTSKWEHSPSLVAESDTQLHIAYAGSNNLRYSFWDGNSEFAYTTVDSLAMYINEATVKLALDVNRTPHVFYSGTGVVTRLNYLRYAKKVDGVWTIEDLESGVDSNAETLIIDGGNKQHILYRAYEGGVYNIKYRVFNGASWENTETVAQSEQTNRAQLVLDSEGNPHVLYINGGGDSVGLNYAKRDNVTKAWSTQNISTAIELRSDLSVAMDSKDTLYAVYKDEQKYAIQLATLKKYGMWEFSELPNGEGASLALDANGLPNMAYVGVDNELQYLQWTGAEWLPPVTLDTPAVSGYPSRLPSLSFDKNNRPNIIYVTGAEDYLKYAVWR